MNRFENSQTQPFLEMAVFNNPDVVAKGWYVALPSKDLDVGQIHSMLLCGQRIVLFRGADARVRALDGYCAHMGADLGIGAVVGNEIVCNFHNWAYAGDGACTKIPCQTEIPAKAKLQAYAVAEKYGFVWVYPDATAPHGVPEYDELKGHDVMAVAGVAYERNCHHHVTMINGIDPQHLKTIHKLNIEMSLKTRADETGRVIDYSLSGEIPSSNVREKIGRWLLGPKYRYSMRYVDACVGLLTTLQDVRLFGTRLAPPTLHMIFAYRPIEGGRCFVQPIYVTKKRRGPIGFALSALLLWLVKTSFYVLRDEDGAIYDNIRFQPGALLPIDGPVAHFMGYVNRLQPSVWSRRKPIT